MSTTHHTDSDRDESSADRSIVHRTASALRTNSGSFALLAGSMLFARGIGRRQHRGRALVQGLAGATLIGAGIRQHRSPSAETDDAADHRETGNDHDGTGSEKAVSDDAHAAVQSPPDDPTPRGADTSDDDDRATTGEGQGQVQFSEDQRQEPHSDPQLDADAEDPRLDDYQDDDVVEVDVSEAALADEASEATGAAPEQAEPALTEGTEPEYSPPEDTSHVEADVPGDGGTTEGGPDAENQPDAGGSQGEHETENDLDDEMEAGKVGDETDEGGLGTETGTGFESEPTDDAPENDADTESDVVDGIDLESDDDGGGPLLEETDRNESMLGIENDPSVDDDGSDDGDGEVDGTGAEGGGGQFGHSTDDDPGIDDRDGLEIDDEDGPGFDDEGEAEPETDDEERGIDDGGA